MTALTPPGMPELRRRLLAGMVIPAHPLALGNDGRWSVRHQRALTRYYHASGAGGVAVGVHTTQFAIRDPRHGLFEPVLALAAETLAAADAHTGRVTLRVAGLCGPTAQAQAEACQAAALGYHAGLLSLAALAGQPEDELLDHCRAIAEVLPLFGFYLQPAVGGIRLGAGFWRRFMEIPQVVAIKVAPFNRYQTLDVLRALAASGRVGEIALYTGNDDHIVGDLVTEYRLAAGSAGAPVAVAFAGGLLGQWACWTGPAVRLWETCRAARAAGAVPVDLLATGVALTDANAALFDAAHDFAGCLPGIHAVLHRQGLLPGTRCLDPDERLSPGQAAEIDRVCRAYPFLQDDEFVRQHRDEWLR